MLIKSDKRIVVIENKIDSCINGVPKEDKDKETGRRSQLEKYYNIIKTEKENRQLHFYVLAPKYSGITREELNKYKCGKEYVPIYYSKLYEILSEYNYKPNNQKPSCEAQFLFGQFIHSLEFLTWTKARQRERIAFIRLKQRITELKANNTAS